MPDSIGTVGEALPKFRFHKPREIYEQPEALRNTIGSYMDRNGSIRLDRELEFMQEN